MTDVNEILLHSAFIKQKGYWEKKLTTGMEATELQPAYRGTARTSLGTASVDTAAILIPEEVGRRVVGFGKGSDLSVYIVLLTVLKLLVYRCTNNRDITVVSPVFLDNVSEDTINRRLYIRDIVVPDGTFAQLLLAVRQSLLEAYENQDYPSGKLLQYLFPPGPVQTAHGGSLTNITCLLKNIHDPRTVEPGDRDGGLIVSFEREGEGLRGSISFSSGLYEENFIRRFARYFSLLLENCLNDAKAPIPSISFAPEEEIRRSVHDFNQTRSDYPDGKTIHRLFREQAAETPDNTAVIDSDTETRLTYKELETKSDRLAYHLRQKGVKPGSVVAVTADRAVGTVIEIIAVLKAGGAFLPIDPRYPAARKQFILADSGAMEMPPESGDIYNGNVPGPVMAEVNTPGDTAYIIYTSGTTGKPKGVMVEHRGLVNYTWWAAGQYVKEEAEALDFPLFTSLSFDLTVTSVFTPLITGNAVVVYPETGEESGLLIEKVIDDNRVGVVKLTPSHLQLIREKIPGPQSRIRRFIVGGEELKTGLAHDIHRNFPGVEIYNEYGPTEATVGCMIHKYDPREDNRPSVPIGVPAGNLRVYILDRQGDPVPPGIVGELTIAGDGLARGYLNRPELTGESFFNRSYKTGDLARMLPNPAARGAHIAARGAYIIEFLGRADCQVKIRGFRIELAEIERRLSAHESVKEVVVTARSDKRGEKYLCAYFVAHRPGVTPALLRDYLADRLPGHMVPVSYTLLEKIPLTPNGKVDERALPEPRFAVETEYAAPRGELEKQLARIWGDVLDLPRRIGIDDNFFRLGGHSLKATLLVSRIHKALHVKVPLTEVFKTSTIRGLAAVIESAAKDEYISIGKTEEKAFYPLSSAQKRLYLFYRMDPGGTVYNIPLVLRLKGELDREKLQTVFDRLIQRHECLRTSFEMQDGIPVQKIHKNAVFKINTFVGTEHCSVRTIIPFDLSCPPLLRVGLIARETREHILVMDMHHIVTDGVSMAILAREFLALLAGETLPPPRLQYKDYAQWQVNARRSAFIENQERYWLTVFPGELPVLQLPTDYPRPVSQVFTGACFRFELDSKQTEAIKNRAAHQDATLYMFLLAVISILLSKLSGQEDVIVGTPTTGRRHADLENIIGMFVNTLALRNYPEGGKTFEDFLAEVRDRTLAAYENQDYPFEDLVEKVNVSRDAARNPLFDVMLALQNIEVSALNREKGGLTLTRCDFDSNIAKFDLTFICEESEERGILSISVEYCTRLFKEETVRRFTRYFKRITAAVCEIPRKKISEIEMVSQEEKQRLLLDFNRIEAGYPVDRTIHQLFQRQAGKTPDHIALTAQEAQGVGVGHLTYRRLNELSRQLARYLVERGVTEQPLVGIMVPRSLEMIIGILAILKSGCAFVPLNPEAPGARNGYILRESGAEHLLTTRRLFEEGEKVIDWDGDISFIEEHLNSSSPLPIAPANPSNPRELAYVIFTSGSTGKPKGVPISHANLSPLLHWGYKHMALETSDRVVQNLSYYFDWSVWEIFIALTSGSSLHMITKEILLDPLAQAEFIRRNSITVLHITPTQFQAIVNRLEDKNALRSLTLLNIGAEKLTYDLVERTCKIIPDRCRLYNMYGPTEATIMSAVLKIDKKGKEKYKHLSSVPIGDTIANADLLVLSPYLEVCPVNVTGELYIGGGGLAHGYLNDLERSSAVFLENPFETEGVKGKRLYKTGDLVRRLPDGSIEFLGRRDHQVKIRGYRIELGEIENHLLEHDHIKEAAVIDGERENGEKYLCAYIVCEKEGEDETPIIAQELKTFLSRSLPDYMIPAVFVTLARMPLNPNGKIDRNALPVPEGHASESEYIAPRDPVEIKLAAIWAEVLNRSPEISIHADFFEIGGHSLKVLQLLNAVQKEFHVKIDFQDIYQFPTIAGLRELIRGGDTVYHQEIETRPEMEYYELSFAQKRLWLLYQFDPDAPAFNLPQRITLHEPVDEAVVREVFRALTRRHDAFRTSFQKVAGEVVQRIRPPLPVDMRTFDLSTTGDKNRVEMRERLFREESVVPIRPDVPPLFRIKLVKCREDEYDVILTMHHIITDGWSMEILEREFTVIYNTYKEGKGVRLPLKPLRIQYKDYVYWHNSLLADEEKMAKAKAFWGNQLSGEHPVLDLPCDFSRTGLENMESAGYRMVIPAPVLKGLKEIAKKRKASLFMVLLAGFNMLMSRITGQDDILLGVPGAARRHDDLKDIVGLFVNTLIVRNNVNPLESFDVFLERVQRTVLQVLEHQSYPLELICRQCKIRYPEISVFFNMSDFGDGTTLHLKDAGSSFIEWVQEAKFPIVCYLAEYKDGIEINTHYHKGLFRPGTIEKIMKSYAGILKNIAANPAAKVGEYGSGSTGEKKKIKRVRKNR